MTSSPRRRRFAGLAIAGAFGATSLLAACGDDDDADADTTETTSPEDVQAPMDEVLAGMDELVELGEAAEAAAADGDFEAALEEYEELHEVWEEIEGTVKATDRDAYEDFETAQGLIKDGGENEDADRVATGVADQEAAVDAFVEANG